MHHLNRFSEQFSWMFFHHISDFDRIALFRKVPELELKYYSYKTTRVVLIFHKKSQTIPKDFSLRYGNCNRVFVTVPDEFQYQAKEHLSVHNAKHIEQTKTNLQEALPVLKDLVAKDMEFNGHLLVEFAFDMQDDSIYSTASLYPHLFETLKQFKHTLNIYKSNREIHKLTKSKDGRMTLFDAIHKAYPTTVSDRLKRDTFKVREMYIKLKTPLIRLRKGGKLLRSSVLFDGCKTQLREEITDLRTSNLKGINVITPCEDWSQERRVLELQNRLMSICADKENRDKELREYIAKLQVPLTEALESEQYKRRRRDIETAFHSFMEQLWARNRAYRLHEFCDKLYTDVSVYKPRLATPNGSRTEIENVVQARELFLASEMMYRLFNLPKRRSLPQHTLPHVEYMNQSLARAIEEQCKLEYMLFHLDIFNGHPLYGPSGKFPISPKFKEITIFGAHQDEEEYNDKELEDQILAELAETRHIGFEGVFYPIFIPFSRAIIAKYHATRVFRW